jgi:hypothetical protein
MPVFDTNDAPINPSRFADKLIGAMCEVTFTFKHITIGTEKGQMDLRWKHLTFFQLMWKAWPF